MSKYGHELFLVILSIGLIALIDLARHWPELVAGASTVARCPRCDGMRVWRHRCPDAETNVNANAQNRVDHDRA